MLLHWVLAAMIALDFFWGWWMQSIPKQPPGVRADAYNLHKSVGLAILLLMVVRIGWLALHRAPPLPPMSAWQRRAAHANHVLMYIVLLALSVGGYLGSAFSGYPVKFFGVTLPAWAAKNDALKDLMSVVHLALSWVIAVAVSLHVAAVVKHTLESGSAFISRMGWRARPRH